MTEPLHEVVHISDNTPTPEQRREALLELRQWALPAGAPGAWIRDAIDAELAR